jgi:hypothetical protein
MREIEYTRWHIGRCVVLCGCKLGGSLAGDECKLGGGCCKCECAWETEGFVWKLSDSCQHPALHQIDTYV